MSTFPLDVPAIVVRLGRELVDLLPWWLIGVLLTSLLQKASTHTLIANRLPAPVAALLLATDTLAPKAILCGAGRPPARLQDSAVTKSQSTMQSALFALTFGRTGALPLAATTLALGAPLAGLRPILAVLLGLIVAPAVRRLVNAPAIPLPPEPAGAGRGGIRPFIRETFAVGDARLTPTFVGLLLAAIVAIVPPRPLVLAWLGPTAWIGPWLAPVLAAPFSLSGGGEVALAAALLVKGAGLGTVVAVLLAAPVANLVVGRAASAVWGRRPGLLLPILWWLSAGFVGSLIQIVVR